MDRRLTEIEATLAAIENPPVVFEQSDIARAGAFVSIDAEGRLRVERGYLRPEDELPVEPEPEPEADFGPDADHAAAVGTMPVHVRTDGDANYASPQPAPEPEEEDGIKPLPDRLLTELTAHRTLALRLELGYRFDVAFLAVLHALCLRVFYHYALDTCLDLDVKSVTFGAQAPGLNDTVLARTLAQRHQDWSAKMPKQPDDLWATLTAMGELHREALFAHCVGLSVNGVFEVYSRRPKALAHADVLARAVDLNTAAAGWAPTVDNYLGRVTKARIVQAVREAKGSQAAQAIEPLKKGDMAERAQELLAGSGWLPEPLRTPDRAQPVHVERVEAEADPTVELHVEEMAADGGEPAMADDGAPTDDEPVAVNQHAIAAE